MNNKFFFVIALLCGASLAFAQEMVEATDSVFVDGAEPDTAQVQLPTDSLGIHPWNGNENDNHIIIPDQSHWSIYLPIGFNITDADFTSEKKHAVWLPTVGLGGAYHWNNTWALGLEYKFRNYRVTGSDIMEGNRRRDAEVMLKGCSHQGDLYLTMDVFNMFRPQNKKKLFALDLIVGGGAIWWKNSIQYGNVRLMSKILSDTPWDYNTAKETPTKMDKYKFAGVLLVGTGAEFNLNRSFQLGLRGTYHYTTTDQVDNRVRVENNDGFFDCELLLRYKFEPRGKSNVRNFMVPEQIGYWNDGTYYEDPAMGAAKRAKYNKPTDGRVDTLYIITRDTVYSMSRDTLVVQQPEVVAAPVAVPAPLLTNKCQAIRSYVVFFANDKHNLDDKAMSTLHEAAITLANNPEYKAVIIGSCDNTGAVTYNKWLAFQRATNVTNMLKELGTSDSRIYKVGRGIMQDDRAEGSFEFNRRVEINIVDDENWMKAKEEYKIFEKNAQVQKGSAVRQPGEGKDASSSAALKEAMEKMKSTAVPALKEMIQTVINGVAPQSESDK